MYNNVMNQGDFENLLRLLKLIGGKFIIVEEGKPKAVLMDYEEFQDLAVPVCAGKLISKIEEINQKITEAQLQDLREEVIQENLPENFEEIRIEPLTG